MIILKEGNRVSECCKSTYKVYENWIVQRIVGTYTVCDKCGFDCDVITINEEILDWSKVFNGKLGTYHDIYYCMERADKCGYDYLAWGDRIYHIGFVDNHLNLEDTGYTVNDLNS